MYLFFVQTQQNNKKYFICETFFLISQQLLQTARPCVKILPVLKKIKYESFCPMKLLKVRHMHTYIKSLPKNAFWFQYVT